MKRGMKLLIFCLIGIILFQWIWFAKETKDSKEIVSPLTIKKVGVTIKQGESVLARYQAVLQQNNRIGYLESTDKKIHVYFQDIDSTGKVIKDEVKK